MAYDGTELYSAGSAYRGILGTTTGKLDAILRDVFKAGVDRLWVMHTPALQWFKDKAPAEVKDQGRRFVFTVEVAPGSSFGARGEKEELPRFEETLTREGELYSQYLYQTMRITGQAIKYSESKKGSIRSALKTETKNLIDTSSFHLQRQIWNDGNGVLAMCSTANQSSLISGSTYEVTVNTSPSVGPSGVRHFMQGMLVAWGTLAGSAFTTKGYGRVLSVNSSTGKVTIIKYDSSQTPGTASGGGNEVHYFVTGDDLGHSYGKEFIGLRKILNTSPDTYAGISGSANTQWNGQTYSVGSNQPVDSEQMLNSIDQYFDATGRYPTMGIWEPAMATAYRRSLVEAVRFNGIGAVEGGQKKMIPFYHSDAGEIPIHTDRMCFSNELTWIENEKFNFGWVLPWEWITAPNNGAIFQQVPNKDIFVASRKAYGGFYCTMRNAGMRVTGFDPTV